MYKVNILVTFLAESLENVGRESNNFKAIVKQLTRHLSFTKT